MTELKTVTAAIQAENNSQPIIVQGAVDAVIHALKDGRPEELTRLFNGFKMNHTRVGLKTFIRNVNLKAGKDVIAFAKGEFKLTKTNDKVKAAKKRALAWKETTWKAIEWTSQKDVDETPVAFMEFVTGNVNRFAKKVEKDYDGDPIAAMAVTEMKKVLGRLESAKADAIKPANSDVSEAAAA